jgi:general secretion pathway protein K
MKKALNTPSCHKQKGVALIVVLLIVAIITVIAVEMSSRLQLNVARTLNLKANNQAYWYALGAEQFAKKSLITLNTLTPENTNLSQPWAETFEYPVEGGSIKAQLIDMQACFNLNAINSGESANTANSTNSMNSSTATNSANPTTAKIGPSPSQKSFQLLLESYINDSLVVETIRDSLIDWIDKDSIPNNYGAEDADYESLVNPYLAANSPLGHASEIRLINGIDQLLAMGGFQDLRKAICVLPESKLAVNVNTITKENAVVLSALLGQNSNVGADIIGSRPPEGFQSDEAFLNLSEVQALSLSKQQKSWFKVTTQYFRLNVTAKFQGSQFTLSTIFKVDSSEITIISREFGGGF